MKRVMTPEERELLEDWYNHMHYHGSRHAHHSGNMDEFLCFLQWRAAGKPVVQWLALPDEYKHAVVNPETA